MVAKKERSGCRNQAARAHKLAITPINGAPHLPKLIKRNRFRCIRSNCRRLRRVIICVSEWNHFFTSWVEKTAVTIPVGAPESLAIFASIKRGWNLTTRSLIQMPGIDGLCPLDRADKSRFLMRSQRAASSNVKSWSRLLGINDGVCIVWCGCATPQGKIQSISDSSCISCFRDSLHGSIITRSVFTTRYGMSGLTTRATDLRVA